MKNMQRFYFIVLSFLAIGMTCYAIQMTPASSGQKVVVNNRVITKVNGNPISVIDLMKKMDLMFYQAHSEHLDSSQLRYQFYMANWQDVLKSMIDRELVYLDAEAQNMPISPGDVRVEIEDIFGPNVLENLEQAGLTYEEVSKLIRADILIRRMLTYSVNLKAMKSVTPEDIVLEYERDKANMYQQLFHFRIMSVKSSDSAKAQVVADRICELVNHQLLPVDTVEAHLRNEGALDETIAITVSPVFIQKKSEFSPHIYELLHPLQDRQCSLGTMQKGTVRMYYLERKEQQEAPLLSSSEEAIREKLVHKAMIEESDRYFSHLRKHYDLNPDDIVKSLPDSFKPFELK